MTGELPRFHPLGTQGMLVTLGEAIAIDLSERIGLLTDRLDTLHLAGVEDIVPSYTTVTLLGSMSPDRWAALMEIVRALWRDIATAPLVGTARRTVEIPVAYGGQHGPDLAAVAAHTGLSESEVVRRHSEADYIVGALGFAPGFAFLTGLPPDLATPRRARPRTAVPAGSVGIGGAQTGVYALPTPGGWSLIGRTPERLFDPHRAEPFTLRMGDRVRFQPIPGSTYRPPAPAVSVRSDRVRRPAIAVVSPGLQTTVQDLGRPGMGRLGVTPGGAADRGALIRGNRRAGNTDDAAALELTIAGPHLRVLLPLRIALSGADLGAHLDGQRLPANAVRVVRPGDELTFDPGQALRGSGARAYLCARGGIDAPVVLGSRSTDLTAALGGLDGRPLRAGDVLAVGGALPSTTHEPTRPVRVDRRQPLRIVPGPQADRFDAGARERLLTATWVVGTQSNRVGLRLEGPPLVPPGGADVISEGMVTGAIQITGTGQPIVMGPARATVGGYARIATVIAADLDRLGQLRPGDRVRFTLDEEASGDG